MRSLSISQYQISVWKNWSAAMGMVLSGSVWRPDEGRESPGELLHNEKKRHTKCEAKTVQRTTIFESHSNWAFLLSCCLAVGVLTAVQDDPCSKGRKHSVLSTSPPSTQKHCKKSTFGARKGQARAVQVPDLHLFNKVILSALGLTDNYTQQPAATAGWLGYRQWRSVSYGVNKGRKI